jgi:hypothetical protein
VSSSGSQKASLPHEEPEPDARGELSDETCEQGADTADGPFDFDTANGMLQHSMDSAASCGLHTVGHFDLTLHVTFGNAGCVADVTLKSEVPSSIGECLLRRFKQTKVKAFSGAAPTAEVRMTNDRSWWSWM